MKANTKVITAIGILLVCNIYLYVQVFAYHEAKCHFIKEFPSRISDWKSKDVLYNAKTLRSLDPDKIIYKTYYRKQTEPPVTLFIAYYDTLGKADLSHSPIVCFTGQGWKIEEAGEELLPLEPPKGTHIMVNKIYLKRTGTKMIALYWYQCPSHAFANRGFQKLYMFWAKMWGRSDGNAFVRVTVTIPDGESEQRMITYLSSFVKILYPALQSFFS